MDKQTSTGTESLCEKAKQASRWVWKSLKEAYDAESPLNEESITEFLILRLVKSQPTNFVIRAFTKSQESKNGSDWEWWFGSAINGWIGIRIQAKRIDTRTNRFKSLIHKNQLSDLIDSSRKSNVIPMYCFYNYWMPGQIIVSTTYYIPDARSYSNYGASLVRADMLNPGSSTNHLDSLIRYFSPLHSLFCTADTPTMDFPHSIHRNLKNMKGFDISADDPEQVIRPELPEELQRLYKARRDSDTEKEVGRDIDGDYPIEDVFTLPTSYGGRGLNGALIVENQSE